MKTKLAIVLLLITSFLGCKPKQPIKTSWNHLPFDTGVQLGYVLALKGITQDEVVDCLAGMKTNILYVEKYIGK